MIQPTPWFERKFEFNYPVGYFPVIVERLRGTLPQLESLTRNIPGEKLTAKADGWSVKEHIGHLCDLEELWYARIEDYLSGNRILTPADLLNTKTHEANHNAKKVAKLLQQFSAARIQLIEKIEGVDEATALLTAIHPRLQTPMRMIDSLFFVAEHDDHHLMKMRALL
jgi:uncharacterized damage-inducible protein DinB